MNRAVVASLALLLVSSCRNEGASASRALIVYEAASLTAPMRPLLDSFARQSGAVVAEEHGASLELARRLTDLARIPDVIALADEEVFPELLMPRAMSWYAIFAHNRMVIAYTDRSRHAEEVSPLTWRSLLLRDDILLGRTDPVLAPAGYRALLVYQLAESFYHEPGLAARLAARTPPRLLRANAAELAGLLSAGELDYIIEYESLARSQHFRFIELPPEIDLSDPNRAASYRLASVRVASIRDTVTRRGAPILYGVSIPRRAPHPEVGLRFMRFMLGSAGQAMLRHAFVDALERPQIVGDSAPAALRSELAPR